MRQGCVGICIALVDVDELGIIGYESLIAQDTGFSPRGFHHLPSYGLKVIELTRFKCQLDMPRYLVTHSITFWKMRSPLPLQVQTGQQKNSPGLGFSSVPGPQLSSPGPTSRLESAAAARHCAAQPATISRFA